MSIFVVGINHKTAPIAIREKIYFPTDKLALYLQDMMGRFPIQESVLLSTCNRSELYCKTEEVSAAIEWFCAQALLPIDQVMPYIYYYQDQAAVGHMMQVACGLDSMVLGEPQILGQMKSAFSESCAAGTVGTAFHRLFQHIFLMAKEIRTSTAIGACPVSMASAAVRFAKQQVKDFSQAQIALIGAGDTTALLMRYLRSENDRPFIWANRDKEKAKQLSNSLGDIFFSLNELKQALTSADIVFSATGSATPILNESLLSEIMQVRQNKPMTLIDIAVPRDIDPAVTNVKYVSLYCIDDLKEIIEKNRQGREHAAEKAHNMILRKSKAFTEELASLEKVSHTIRAYRSQVEEICRIELIKAKQQLHQGMNPDQVLDVFANAFTKKLLHAPSVQLRQAGAEGRYEILNFAKQLFSLSDPDIELL